jgi:two-component system phosphate regulon sensor histidine kinase PhoR
MDKSLYTYHKVKVMCLLSFAFVLLFLAYLFSGAWFVMTYVFPNIPYAEAVSEVLQAKAFWFFFIVQLFIYATVVFVILNTFYNERRMTLMQQDFVNNVTHEIKTPLSTILMAAEVLVEENIHNNPFRREQYVSIIRYEGERLREELDRVLDVARMTKIGVHLNKDVISAKEVLQLTIERMQLQISNCGGDIQVNWDAVSDQILFDRNSLELIFTNIIDNALKYNINEPRVVIQGNVVDANLIIQIKDNGIGINEQYHKELFHRFFRVPLGESHHMKGFGLGLYLVKQLMDVHNASVYVKSAENEGTTVTLKFPLVKNNNE